MTLKELEKDYKKRQLAWKVHIRWKPTKWKRFWAWVWYLIAFPWVWLFYNIRDWRSLICIFISFLLWSSSVWLFYLLGFIFYYNETLRNTMFGIGSAVWIWWASPVGSPFILLVTFTAIGIKALFNKVKHREKKSHKKNNAKIEIINEENAQNLQKCDKKYENKDF